ncbi:murein hydrolase activator EnvC family protein [Neisseria lisongii]
MMKSALQKIICTLFAATLAACSGSHAPGSKAVPAGYYRVQAGDTLYRIAKRYGQSVQTLVQWNHLSDAAKIEVGQVLKVQNARSHTPAHTANTNTAAVRQKMQWPVDNGGDHVVQSYNGSSNKGIDIIGVRGQNVKAAADGKVLYAGEGVRGYGKLLLISHSPSLITAYAHNDSLLVAENQTVRAGQTVATMGSSDSDRVKLHFEVRVNGKAVNPMPYLR